MNLRRILAICAIGLFALQAHGQQSGNNPNSLINIHVSQNLPTVNYHATGSTKVNFVGTPLLPRADGDAKIAAQGTSLRIQANFKGLVSPQTFGPEYLVYVLWAITPEGRATNLGQLDVKDGKSQMDVTTKLQTFGLMVTAEPYFAVSFPSEKVVLANSVRHNTKGTVAEVNANMALLQRGNYSAAHLPPFSMDPKVPLDLYQARNAVRIAKYEQAAQYAPAALAKAEADLRQAEDYQHRKQKKAVHTLARQAVESAEDARAIAVKHLQEQTIAQQQQAQQQQAQQAQLQAQQAQQQAAQAQEEAKLNAEKRALAQQKQALAEQQASAAQAAKQQAEAQAQSAQQAAAKAEAEKQQLRARLLQQFNQVLPTIDTPRGLQVNLGDVLFDTGKADLRTTARESLAKLSGIVLNYPTLQLAVEGYTDSTGSPEFNQTLSDKRAEAVRNYLVSQGLNPNSITAKGFGEASPVADNSTAAGRQQNRRVEIIVSGNVIGTKIGSPQP